MVWAAGERSFFPPGYTMQYDVPESIARFGFTAAQVCLGLEHGLWPVACRLWLAAQAAADCGLLPVACFLWPASCGLLPVACCCPFAHSPVSPAMACGGWPVADGPVADGLWPMACGRWPVAEGPVACCGRLRPPYSATAYTPPTA